MPNDCSDDYNIVRNGNALERILSGNQKLIIFSKPSSGKEPIQHHDLGDEHKKTPLRSKL